MCFYIQGAHGRLTYKAHTYAYKARTYKAHTYKAHTYKAHTYKAHTCEGKTKGLMNVFLREKKKGNLQQCRTAHTLVFTTSLYY